MAAFVTADGVKIVRGDPGHRSSAVTALACHRHPRLHHRHVRPRRHTGQCPEFCRKLTASTLAPDQLPGTVSEPAALFARRRRCLSWSWGRLAILPARRSSRPFLRSSTRTTSHRCVRHRSCTRSMPLSPQWWRDSAVGLRLCCLLPPPAQPTPPSVFIYLFI